MTEKLRLQTQTWHKDNYLVSTDWSLLPLAKVNEALASKDLYWAMSMPEDVLQVTLESSLCFGLYDTSDKSTPKLLGMARCITDFTTFVYLTDVYVWPEHQGLGLGRWLIQCVQASIESMPYVRRSMLFTSNWERSVPFYAKLMDMKVFESHRPGPGEPARGPAMMERKGPGLPKGI